MTPTGASAAPLLAVAIPDLRGGGAERVALALAAEFFKAGYRTDILVMRPFGELLSSVPEGVRLVDLRAPRARNLVPRLIDYLDREKPTALLAHMWPLTCFAVASRCLARSGCRVICVDHNILSRAYASFGRLHSAVLRLSLRSLYPLSDACVAVSAGVAADLRRLGGIPRERISVIHNPVARPGDGATGNEGSRLWRSVPRGGRILTVGALKAQKNHHLLIRAFEMIRCRDARLVILGEGPLRRELERFVEDRGLEGRVHMPGFSHPDPYYRSADVFVLSSDYEGFGNVLVEALACGLPVVSTDCPSGPAEILDAGRYGRLVPTGNAAALASAIEAALTEECDQAFSMSRAADFAPERAAEQYLALLA